MFVEMLSTQQTRDEERVDRDRHDLTVTTTKNTSIDAI